jgi:hypothetical protein
MEWALGFPIDSYDQVVEIFYVGGTTVRDKYFGDYVKARLLDFTREGCSFLFLMLLISVVYMIAVVSLKVFAPLVTWAELLLEKRLTRRLKNSWLATRFAGKVTEATYREARERASMSSNLVFSYRLSENPRYKEAHAALSASAAAIAASAEGTLLTFDFNARKVKKNMDFMEPSTLASSGSRAEALGDTDVVDVEELRVKV